MQNITLPKKFIVEEEIKGKKAKVIIEPCFPGYGLTLGNALRRVLLSSLPGGAITAVKIKGVGHEFDTIDHVSEDMVELILNLKKVNVKVHSNEPVVLHLKAKGELEVTAGDIEASADAEIINKDLHIASLNNKDAELELELTVAKGIGYVPTEEQNKDESKGEIGLILIDSIYTPVLNVGLDIGATRVGQKVDYDKIILDIETDGTISPEEAVQKASEILINQFSWVIGGGREEVEEIDIEAPVMVPEKEIEIVEELVELEKKTEEVIPAEVEIISTKDEADEKPKKRGRPKKIEE
ncbi:MAG TPA: DNA-directed RNA polymerase subunit alpha [Patescibacteria group bacterium]|nr:DNA-directed RNA polymerase subunit alpha [Patescibacteria group bacterium]